jgi:UDP-glucose 4-epimerase
MHFIPDCIARPLEVYGESKLATETLVRAFHDDTGIPAAVLRLFNAIGANETNPHVIPHIFESLRHSDVVRLGNVDPCRDYIDTRDIARAIVAVADRARGGEAFNVGTGVAASVRDVIALLGAILGRDIAIEQEPSRVRAAERMRLVADIGKIRREIGWAPEIPLRTALEDLVRAYGLRAAASPAS